MYAFNNISSKMDCRNGQLLHNLSSLLLPVYASPLWYLYLPFSIAENLMLICCVCFFLVLILSTSIRTRTYRSYSLSRRVVIAHRARSLTFYVVNLVVTSREQFSSAGHISLLTFIII